MGGVPPAGGQSGGRADPWASLQGQWGRLGVGQRRTIIGAAAAVLAVVGVWAAVVGRGPTLVPLYTRVPAQSAAAIVAKLHQAKVPYRLAANGATILVPQRDVAPMRLQMAAAGLPKSGTVGLGSVLTLPFGATSFTRHVAYLQGLQGELAATIDQVRGVRSSRVQIVLPRRSTFASAAGAASAAVLVHLQPGVRLTSGQVGAVAHLVASSVPGLRPQAVTVIDQHGTILWSQGSGGSTGGAATGPAALAQNDLSVRHSLDTQLQSGLVRLLDQVFGPGNVVAHVHAQMSFNSGTLSRTTFLPKGAGPAVVRSMQQLKQTVVGTGAPAAVPGTATNSFPTYTAGAGGGKTSSTSNQLTQNFDVGSETQHTIVAPGTVSRLSVAVVINRKLTAAQLALVRSTVQAAVGASTARHDQITVVGMPFQQTLLHSFSGAAAGGAAPALPQVAWIAAAVLGALLLAVILLLLLRRRREVEPGLDGATAETLTPAYSAVGAVDAGSDPLAAALATAQAHRDRLQGTLRERPADVARVIRVWLSQDE